MAIGDVTCDGRPDVVLTTTYYFDAANDYHVFVFTQTANGLLGAPVSYPYGATANRNGIVLADLARHIAHAHELQNEGVDTNAFLQRLLEGFQAEIDNPTDEQEGEVTQ